jgi:chromosome partitioning protein
MAPANTFITRIIAFVNIKGGVAKSVSSLFVAWGLAILGFRVLLVDMDPQSNTTYSLTGELYEEPEGTLYEVLREQEPKTIRQIIKPTKNPNLFIAPGSLWLSSTEADLVTAMAREWKLKTALDEVLPYFHYIIIDTPPNVGLLTINALVAATDLIIPVYLKLWGLVGVRILNRTLATLRLKFARFGLTFPVLGVLVTQVRRPMTRNGADRLEQLRSLCGDKLFTAMIPLNEKLEESTDQEVSGYDYAPTSPGVLAYSAVVKEIIERVNLQQKQTDQALQSPRG